MDMSRSGDPSFRYKVLLAAGLSILLLSVETIVAQNRGSSSRWRRDRMPETRLKVGDMAADFTLQTPDSRKKVSLSSYRGKRPVVLVFGSYT